MFFLYYIVSFISLVFCDLAYGYIDPGVIGSLYQVAYVIVFALVSGLVFTPFKKVKQFFTSLKRGAK